MDDMPQNLMLRKIGTVGGGKIVRVTDPRLPHTGYTRTDTIATHPDVKRLVAAIQKQFVTDYRNYLSNEVKDAIQQLTGDTPTNGDEG